MQFPVGYRFHPTDWELLGFFLYNKIFQPTLLSGHTNVIQFDLYGSHEPSDIWTLFGGDSLLEDEPSLFFFTNLKKKSSKGRRICRTVASGTWAGEDSGERIEIENFVGFKKRFRYENPSSPHDRAWIMHEYSFDFNDTVVCRLKRNKSAVGQRKKRKSKSTEEHVDDSEAFVQNFRPKWPRTERCPTPMVESQPAHSLTNVQPEGKVSDVCFVDEEEEQELLMKLLEDLPSLANASDSGPAHGLQWPQLLDSFADAVTVETEENAAQSSCSFTVPVAVDGLQWPQLLDSFVDAVTVETEEYTAESSYSLTVPVAVDGTADDDDDDDSWWDDVITLDDLAGLDSFDVPVPTPPTILVEADR